MNQYRHFLLVVGFLAIILLGILALSYLTPGSAIAAPQSTDICGPQAGTIITWTQSQSPYLATCQVVIEAGSTLIVEPGVVVYFNGPYGLEVRGQINAYGNAAQPILCTGVESKRGFWTGIFIKGTDTSFNSGSILDYVTIEYGAYPASDANLNLEYASAVISHSTFRNSDEYGIATFFSSFIEISDSTFTGNTLGAIYFGDASVNQTISNLTIQNNDKDIIVYDSGNILTNNQWILLPPNVHYVVAGNVRIGSGGSLTIDPGVEVDFTPASTFWVMEDGRLIAVGSSDKPIRFTGVDKIPGSWAGIRIIGTESKFNNGSRIQDAIIEYGGWSNVSIEWGVLAIKNCTISNSSGYGIYGGIEGHLNVSFTNINSNADYAIYLANPLYLQTIYRINAAGNGSPSDLNAIALGTGTISGIDTMGMAGIPYHVLGDLTIAPGGQLFIVKGTIIHFAQSHGLQVNGVLNSGGSADQPVKFTGIEEAPGSWEGIKFEGTFDAPSTGSNLVNTIVEYGGASVANMYISWAQVSIENSIIRKGQHDGIYIYKGGDLVTIKNSQIIDNGSSPNDYGIYNDDPLNTVVSASNNWWGDASGPTFGGPCHSSGSGSRVSGGVDFLPVLGDPNGKTSIFSPGTLLSLTLQPDRWYLPADGALKSVITATLRDSSGLPVPGRTVLATTTLGDIVDGGITDLNGQTHILISSTTAGDAQVTAKVDQSVIPCGDFRVAKTTITFQPFGETLLPDSESPYSTADISIDPEPLTRGSPSTISIKFTNPNDHPILVNASLGIAQSGIGLLYGPLEQWQDVVIEANGIRTLNTSYTPLIEGHYCLTLEYAWQESITGTTTLTGAVTSPIVVMQGSSSQARLNMNSLPSTFRNPYREDDEDQQVKKTPQFNNYQTPTTPPSDPPEKRGVNQRISDSFQVTRDIGNSMRSDPPSHDYKTIVQPVKPVTPIYSPGGVEELTSDQAAAVNILLDALADAIAYGRAVLGSEDRYAGATEAGDLTWAAQQAAAVLHYDQQTGLAYVRVADALQKWLDVYPYDRLPSLVDVTALQQRLITSGFTTEEIARFRALGCSDESIEWIRQDYVSTDPYELTGSQRAKYLETVEIYRSLGILMAYPDPSFSQQMESASGLDITSISDGNLARVYDIEDTIEVGNPLAAPATIDLKVRNISLPSDWAATVWPNQLTLNPGDHQTVTVRISPGSTSVQGTISSIAVEGFVNGMLIGGVEFKVLIPSYTPFGLRLFLPLVTH